MSISTLTDSIILTDNYSSRNGHEITRITPHYMAAYWTGEQCAESFLPASRMASANYCIGYDGDICCNVEEENRAWTSSSSYNDEQAITIECANYMEDWRYGQLPDATWNSLVQLCVDICTRYDFTLNYTGDDSGNLTMHKWYGATDCPGPWFSENFGRLADEVNAILNGSFNVQTEDEMICAIKPYDQQTIYYIDGSDIHPLADPDELVALQDVYRITHGGNELPVFEMGHYGYPIHQRLFDALKRKM